MSIVHKIPGGWYGNDPGSFNEPKRGNVVVSGERVADAITWLKRRATILSTRVERGIADRDGLLIAYELRR